jgi:twinkle protein
MQSEFNILEYISGKSLNHKIMGSEIVADCPYCGKEKHFYINARSGLWECKKCLEKGNTVTLRRKFGDIEYLKPVELKRNTFPKPSLAIENSKNLFTDKEAMDFLSRERMLSEEIIRKFSLGVKIISRKKFISIPYFKDRVLVNIKYRCVSEKDFRREKDCQSTVFNIDSAIGNDEVIVTEGEFDAIAGEQLGFKNVVSVPNGANVQDDWVSSLERFERVKILFDNDSKGEEASQKLALRLGKSRCERWYLPLKDLNLCLMAGLSLEDVKAKSSKKDMFDAPVVHSSELFDETIEFIKTPQNSGIQTEWIKFNKALGGIRMGEVTSITADTGSGKTTWILNIITQLVSKSIGCLVASTEMSPKKLMTKIFSIYSGQSIYDKEMFTDSVISRCCAFFGMTPLYIVPVHGQLLISKIEEIVDYVVRTHDVKVVVLDHLHFFLDIKRSEDERTMIDAFMKKIVLLAKRYSIHIFLIAHPSKFSNDKGVVSMNSFKGSSSIKQDSDNIILIHRNREDERAEFNKYPVTIYVAKVRDDSASGGSFDMNFCPKSQSYREEENDKPV